MPKGLDVCRLVHGFCVVDIVADGLMHVTEAE